LINRNFDIDYGIHPIVSVLILLPFIPGIALLSAWLKQSFSDKRHLLLNLGESQAIQEAQNASTLAAMGINDRRMITAFLHNSVQSELQGLLKQLEKAVATNSQELSRDAMEKLNSFINRSARDDFEMVSTNPEKRFEKLLAAWDGIVAIESSLASNFFADHTYAPVVVEILEEFVTNGVRHSGASEVFISGKDDAKGFILTLTRDGEPSKKGKPGLGTKLLESVSHQISETRLLNDRTQLQITL
jgi:nitrate/nitrite-specific signal transduction histidine kinase